MRALRFLVSVITLFSIHTCFAQQPKNDWEKENLKGRVKTLTEMRTYDVDSVREKSWLNKPILHIFNEAGNIVLSKRYTLVENSIDSTVYFYDSKNRLSRKLTYGKKRWLRDSINYSYFEDGSKIDHRHFYMNMHYESKSVFTYDSKSNIVHEVTHHIDSFINGKKIEDKDEIITNQYNKKGWLIKTIKAKKDSLPYNVSCYKYDKEGNKVEYREFIKKKLWIIDRYNAKGELIEFIIYDNDEVIRYQTKMTYNEWGDQIGQTGSNRNGEPISPMKAEYEYDSQHNWTKLTWYRGSEIKTVRVRTIDYF